MKMNVTCRLLNQESFTVAALPSTTVGELRKQIHLLKGRFFKWDTLTLIHSGKIWDNNESTLETENYKETEYVVIMAPLAWKRSINPECHLQSNRQSAHGSQPLMAPVAQNPAQQPPAAALPQNIPVVICPAKYREIVDTIMHMGYPRSEAELALQTLSCHLEGAVEYLLSGLPPCRAGGSPALSESREETAASPAQGEPAAGAGADPLVFFRDSPQFQHVRHMIQHYPQLFHKLLDEIGQANPQLKQIILNIEVFLDMLNAEGSEWENFPVGLDGARTLLAFKAGRLTLEGTTVTADPRRGLVYITVGEDELLHFCWNEQAGTDPEDDVLIVPGDVEFRTVPQCSTGRVFLLKFIKSSRRLFYWMQEAYAIKDKERFQLLTYYLARNWITVLKIFFAPDIGIPVHNHCEFLASVGLTGQSNKFRPVLRVLSVTGEAEVDDNPDVVEMEVRLCARYPGQFSRDLKSALARTILLFVQHAVDVRFAREFLKPQEFIKIEHYPNNDTLRLRYIAPQQEPQIVTSECVSASPPPKRRAMKSSPAPAERLESPIAKRRTANVSPTPVNRRLDTRRRVSPVFDDKPSASQRRPVVKSKQEVSGRTRPQTSANVRNVQPPTSRGRDEVMYRGNAVRREKPDGMVRKEKEDVIRKEKRRPVSPPRRKEPSRAVKPVVYDRVSSSSNVSSAGSNRRGHRDDRSLSDVSVDELDDTDNMSNQSSERQENKQQNDLSDQEDGRGRRYSREELEYEEVNSESEGIEDSRVDVDDSRVDEAFDNISPGEERDWEDEEDYQRQEPKKPRQHRPALPEEESDEEIDHYEVSTPDQRNRRNVNAGGKRAEAEHVRLSVSESVNRRGADVDHNVTNTFITGDTGLAGLGGGAMGMSLPAFPPMPLGFPQFSSYRMSMNMSMPLMSLPHSLSAGGPAQFLRLPSPRMMGTTPPMISLTPHDIHQHLAMFQQQQHQNQVQQQHQLSIQQQHQLPVQHQNPARNQEQLPTGTRIKPPVSQRIQLETVQEKQTEGKREEVEQRPQSSQQQKSSTVTIPVRLQQIRLKPPQSNLKPIALTATSPNADAAGRGSPVEPVSASSSTNGRDSTNQAKAPPASPSKAADGPSRTITFKKTEKRAAANKMVNLEMDASFASGSPPPNWSMIPVAVDHKAYSHRGQIDLGVFDWDLLESDPRLSVYCQRASVSMPVKPVTVANVTADCVSSTASAPPEAAVTSSALQVNQSTDAPRNGTSDNALPSVKAEPEDSGSGLDQSTENVMIKQGPLSTEDLKVKEEISDDAAVGPVLTGDSNDVKPVGKM